MNKWFKWYFKNWNQNSFWYWRIQIYGLFLMFLPFLEIFRRSIKKKSLKNWHGERRIRLGLSIYHGNDQYWKVQSLIFFYYVDFWLINKDIYQPSTQYFKTKYSGIIMIPYWNWKLKISHLHFLPSQYSPSACPNPSL